MAAGWRVVVDLSSRSIRAGKNRPSALYDIAGAMLSCSTGPVFPVRKFQDSTCESSITVTAVCDFNDASACKLLLDPQWLRDLLPGHLYKAYNSIGLVARSSPPEALNSMNE